MPIEVHCPACQALFHVGDEFAGRPGRCPECGVVLRVPGDEPPPEPEADPDPYRTPRPVEAYEDPPLGSRRRPRDEYRDDEDHVREDFDDRYRPGRGGFDPHARAAAWERVAKGLWYVQSAMILGAFSETLFSGFMATRGMKEPDAGNFDTGILAVACGYLVLMLAAASFWLLGRFAGIRVPYVPARGWAKGAFGLALCALFLFVGAFCLFFAGGMMAAGGPNPGAVAMVGLAVFTFLGVALAGVAAEVAGLVSLARIGTGLKAPGVAGWAKATIGVMVAILALSVVGFCGLTIYAADQQQKKQAAQGMNGNNANPAPANPDPKEKAKVRAKDAPAPAPAPANPPPDPFDAEPLDPAVQVGFHIAKLLMIYVYLIAFSIAAQKARAAMRHEVKVLTGEADRDPWDDPRS
jgi:hypothetical protein